jgi:hypothetical protein
MLPANIGAIVPTVRRETVTTLYINTAGDKFFILNLVIFSLIGIEMLPLMFLMPFLEKICSNNLAIERWAEKEFTIRENIL